MSKENKKEDKRSFLEYLAIKADIESDSLVGDIYMELRGKNCLLVKGCRRITGYSPKAIMLDLKNDTLTVRGNRLICTAFHNGCVSVEGEILSFSFGTKEEE